jgi:hypothetical protein
MAAYFSAERVKELLAGQHQVHLHFTDLRETMCVRPYKTERGAEFAKHGFCRRLETLVRSIDRVFELLPPAQEKIPERDVVVDAACLLRTPDSGILDGGSDVDILQMLSDDELAGMNCKGGPHWASCRGKACVLSCRFPSELTQSLTLS